MSIGLRILKKTLVAPVLTVISSQYLKKYFVLILVYPWDSS